MFCFSKSRKYQEKTQASYNTPPTNQYDHITKELKTGDNSQLPSEVKEVIQEKIDIIVTKDTHLDDLRAKMKEVLDCVKYRDIAKLKVKGNYDLIKFFALFSQTAYKEPKESFDWSRFKERAPLKDQMRDFRARLLNTDYTELSQDQINNLVNLRSDPWVSSFISTHKDGPALLELVQYLEFVPETAETQHDILKLSSEVISMKREYLKRAEDGRVSALQLAQDEAITKKIELLSNVEEVRKVAMRPKEDIIVVEGSISQRAENERIKDVQAKIIQRDTINSTADNYTEEKMKANKDKEFLKNAEEFIKFKNNVVSDKKKFLMTLRATIYENFETVSYRQIAALKVKNNEHLTRFFATFFQTFYRESREQFDWKKFKTNLILKCEMEEFQERLIHTDFTSLTQFQIETLVKMKDDVWINNFISGKKEGEAIIELVNYLEFVPQLRKVQRDIQILEREIATVRRDYRKKFEEQHDMMFG